MKKTIIVIFFMIAFSCIVVSAQDVSVVMNGNKLMFDNSPIIVNGHTLVPFRKIFETLGYNVVWDNEEQSVKATDNSNIIKLFIGSKNMTINNKYTLLELAPALINSTTYVPIRIISEYSNCDVLWNEETSTVILYTKQKPYESCFQGNYEFLVTDGNHIYTNDEKNVYRFTEELTREILPFSGGNNFAVAENKFFGSFIDGSRHYRSVDLDTFEINDLTGEDVTGCVINNNKIYYGFPPTPLGQEPKKVGIYTMNLDGSEKKQVYDSKLWNYYIKDDLIFSNNTIIPLNGEEPKYINDGFTTATAIQGNYYYQAVGNYTDEKTPLEPVGIYIYNYKTNEKKFIPYDKIIDDIKVTDNSIFITEHKNHGEYSLIRLTKSFEYPVLLKDNIWSDFDVFGNYIYFYEKQGDEDLTGFSRMSTDGKEIINLENHWKNPDLPQKLTRYAKITLTYDEENTNINAFVSIIRNKLESAGFTDAKIKKTVGNYIDITLCVEANTDVKQLADMLVSETQIIFKDSNGNVVIDKNDIIKATYGKDTLRSGVEDEFFVDFELTEEGNKKFYAATKRIAEIPNGENYISIIFNGTIISTPKVQAAIDSKNFVISADFTRESAEYLTHVINSGILPFTSKVYNITYLD